MGTDLTKLSGRGVLVASALIVAAIVAGTVWLLPHGGSAPDSGARELRSRKIADAKAKKSGLQAKRIRGEKAVKAGTTEKVRVAKPDFLAEADEMTRLTAEMKKMFLDLQAALDLNDAKKVYALVHKLQLMDEWPDGIPRSVKLKALQALSWFGAAGMAEAVGFLADSDPQVQQTTMDKFSEMMSDWDLGDTGVSEIIKQVVKVVHDKDALDSFYMELGNMRDTVKAETALAIYDSKNADAISALEDSMDFYFDSGENGGLKGRELVEKALEDAKQAYKDHPEKEAEDEEFYGPMK